MSTPESDAALREIVATLRDGQVFYEEAAKAAPSPQTRQLFARMAEERERGIVKLSPYLAEDVPEDESWAGLADRLYAEFQALLSDPNAVFLEKLREHEATLLETIRKAEPHVAVGAARDAVHEVYEECQRTHGAMAEL